MSEQNSILIYQSQDGQIKVDVRLEGETVWLTQAQMCDLFSKSKSTISEHISNIFSEGELDANSVVRNFRTTAEDGKNYNVNYYNLDVVISLGYRVKSFQGTQFRIWATQRLKEYIIKGFTLDDDRLKGASSRYFDELLDRIREIRLSERLFYQKILDIYAMSMDYDPSSKMAQQFFSEVQNKLLWAISGHTASELVYYRANAELPMMGLNSTQSKGRVTKKDVAIGKNYLNEEEMKQLKLIVEQFLAYAEMQATAQKPMYMRDWIQKLRLILTMNEKNILEHSGKVSHEMAVAKATKEYNAYKQKSLEAERLESIKQLERDINTLEAKGASLYRKTKGLK